jgi:excisionase family DNA binding protein
MSGDKPIAVSIRRAASLIGISPWSVRHAAKAGRLQIARIGRRTLVPVADLERFVRDAISGGKK